MKGITKHIETRVQLKAPKLALGRKLPSGDVMFCQRQKQLAQIAERDDYTRHKAKPETQKARTGVYKRHTRTNETLHEDPSYKKDEDDVYL